VVFSLFCNWGLVFKKLLYLLVGQLEIVKETAGLKMFAIAFQIAWMEHLNDRRILHKKIYSVNPISNYILFYLL